MRFWGWMEKGGRQEDVQLHLFLFSRFQEVAACLAPPPNSSRSSAAPFVSEGLLSTVCVQNGDTR